MKLDMRYLDASQVELRLVVNRELVDEVTRNAETYGQACRAMRERIEATLAQPVTQPFVMRRID